LFGGRPCDLSGCAQSADASVSFAHRFSTKRGEEEQVHELAQQAEAACRRTVADWQRAQARRKGAPAHLPAGRRGT
jgi:hypothetical protein